MLNYSPAEFYIKYLLCHPDNYTDEQIRDMLRLQGLAWLGMTHLERLRSSLPVPAPFYPENRTHRRSQDFLRRERIWAMYHPDDAMQGALQALKRPKAKVNLETLLLTGVAPEYAAAVLRQKDSIDLSKMAVQRYMHFFFNVPLVGLEAMRVILGAIPELADDTDPDAKALNLSTLAAAKADPRRLLVRMAGSPLAQLLNNMRLGYAPTNLDLGKIVGGVRTAAAIMALDSVTQGQPERARDYSLVMKMAHEVVTDVGDGTKGLQSELSSLMLVTEQQSVPTLSSMRPPSGKQIVEAQGESVKQPSPVLDGKP